MGQFTRKITLEALPMRWRRPGVGGGGRHVAAMLEEVIFRYSGLVLEIWNVGENLSLWIPLFLFLTLTGNLMGSHLQSAYLC